MVAFDVVDSVRRLLRSRRLHAAEDGRSVRLDPRRASHKAVRDVTARSHPYAATLCVPHRSAYDRYLGAPDTRARDSLSHCRAAKQRDFEPEIPAIMSPAVDTSRQGAFLMQDATGPYLCANSGCVTRGGLCTATHWAVERVPRAARPGLPTPCDSERGKLFGRVCEPLSCLRVLERGIRWVRSGVFSEDNWTPSQNTGRLMIHLERRLPRILLLGYILYLRAGRGGQPSPLVVNRPRSREPLDSLPYGRA